MSICIYYDKCERDSVLDLYEEMIYYREIESGEVDLSGIKDMLIEYKVV